MSTKLKDSLICGVPPSKSHSMRALLFAAMAKGESEIKGLLDSPDVDAMMTACRSLGAELNWDGETLFVEGVGGRPIDRDRIIDAGGSGQVLRFMGALAALSSATTHLHGDKLRPIYPLTNALEQLGAHVDGYTIQGPMCAGHAVLSGEDSQPVSALLMAAPFVEGRTTIEVKNPKEQPWIDLTLSWLHRMGYTFEHKNYESYTIEGSPCHLGFSYTVPGDFSSAAYPLAAGLVTGSSVTVTNLDMDDIQGDKAFLSVLEEMGAKMEGATIYPSELYGIEIDLNQMIDAVTILAVLGCYAKGETRLFNGKIARKKECDRIACICRELKKMGADIEEREDGLVVRHSALHGAHVESYNDHRMAMSLYIAGLMAQGETIVEGTEWINKSYPNFLSSFAAFGGAVKAQ